VAFTVPSRAAVDAFHAAALANGGTDDAHPGCAPIIIRIITAPMCAIPRGTRFARCATSKLDVVRRAESQGERAGLNQPFASRVFRGRRRESAAPCASGARA
jgi:hypothetical protein